GIGHASLKVEIQSGGYLSVVHRQHLVRSRECCEPEGSSSELLLVLGRGSGRNECALPPVAHRSRRVLDRDEGVDRRLLRHGIPDRQWTYGGSVRVHQSMCNGARIWGRRIDYEMHGSVVCGLAGKRLLNVPPGYCQTPLREGGAIANPAIQRCYSWLVRVEELQAIRDSRGEDVNHPRRERSYPTCQCYLVGSIKIEHAQCRIVVAEVAGNRLYHASSDEQGQRRMSEPSFCDPFDRHDADTKEQEENRHGADQSVIDHLCGEAGGCGEDGDNECKRVLRAPRTQKGHPSTEEHERKLPPGDDGILGQKPLCVRLRLDKQADQFPAIHPEVVRH